MDNPHMSDKDWEELEYGPFIYSDDSCVYEYECNNCGNVWDGYAQCTCACIDSDYDEHNINFDNNEDQIIEILSNGGDNPPEIILVHPDGWTEQNHYNECGDICSCCRAKQGETLDVCLVCMNNKIET